MRNALTFDLEEYFHAEAFAGVIGVDDWPSLASRVGEGTLRLLDLLASVRVHATFFVLGWVAERHPDLVKRIAAAGHEVGCHGYLHRMIRQFQPEEFEGDARRAKATLEDLIGAPVIGYRAPTFSVVRETLWSLEVLGRIGFRYDSSIVPAHHDRYGIPDAPRFPHTRGVAPDLSIVEFPLSTLSVLGHRVPFAGGGYFRLFPYGVTRLGIRHLNGRLRQPAMVYLHPWDMDPGQPRLPVGAVTRFRHSANASRTEGKLRSLLRDFRFGPAREILVERHLLPPAEAA